MIDFLPKISLSWPNVVCVAVEASMNPVYSQLEDSRAMNSEAITACVAITIDPSALAMKTAVMVLLAPVFQHWIEIGRLT